MAPAVSSPYPVQYWKDGWWLTDDMGSGSFDDEVMKRARQSSINIIAQGRCIMVEGSEALAIAKLHGGKL